ncbi:MAG TPA: MarR family winged helix-turn-helix transcriptional regulator [Longimicrobiales bacterium]|nr:MarR family winged helix-turn-helix transcriptional regulator [Longimicrobiales bacterium]
MADISTVIHAYDRIFRACRPRRVADPDGGPQVSAHQAGVLAYLDGEDPTMVGELADYLGVTASTMSLTLKRLEEAGYVRRDRDPADRRVTNVRLTAAGARVRSASTSLDMDRVDALLRALPLAQRAEALRGVVLLADAADALIRRNREAVAAQVGGSLP